MNKTESKTLEELIQGGIFLADQADHTRNDVFGNFIILPKEIRYDRHGYALAQIENIFSVDHMSKRELEDAVLEEILSYDYYADQLLHYDNLFQYLIDPRENRSRFGFKKQLYHRSQRVLEALFSERVQAYIVETDGYMYTPRHLRSQIMKEIGVFFDSLPDDEDDLIVAPDTTPSESELRAMAWRSTFRVYEGSKESP